MKAQVAQLGAAFLLVAALVALPAQAQFQSRGFSPNATHGVPPSVTSYGFGGSRSFNPGIPASVTSPGWNSGAGVSCGNGMLISSAMGCVNPFFQSNIINGQVRFGPFRTRRHHPNANAYPVFIPYAYPVYGYGGYSPESYDGGPAFTPGYQSPDDQPGMMPVGMPPQPPPPPPVDPYASDPPAAPAPAPPQAEVQPDEGPAPPDIPLTVLVFKDGHQQEVRNYAIVGQTLYVLEAFGSHKVPLADLDLKATASANDERGLEFVLPAAKKLN